MEYILTTLGNLVHQSAFFSLTWGNLIMIAVACVFLYLAIRHGFEPLLLVPIAFRYAAGQHLPGYHAAYRGWAGRYGTGGLPDYFYLLDEWSILPSLIFLGVGAMTDFGPLIANPKSFLMGAAAQLGISRGLSGSHGDGILGQGGCGHLHHRRRGRPHLHLPGRQAGADGDPGPHRGGGIFVYMSLVPIIQPPIMKLLTTEKERKIKMEQLRPVSKLERILFPIIVTIVVCVILPTTAPLVGMLMSGQPVPGVRAWCASWWIQRPTH